VHDGHDWMYVLDGRMRLLLGDQDLVIDAGEAVEFSNPDTALVWSGALITEAHTAAAANGYAGIERSAADALRATT